MTKPQLMSCATQSARRALAVGAAMLLVACSEDGAQGQQQEMPPSPVTVSPVATQDVTQYGEYAARVRGAREVQVRARVSGILEERRYDEGEPVEEGQTLFQIEPEPYEIALQSARAELVDARATRDQAHREWERVSGLYERGAVSERERDQAKAGREAADAQLARAKAALDNAERDLRYTRVEAPISGVTGMEAVTEGNLIQPGDLLTTMTQLDPVRVHFALPEKDAVTQRMARSVEADNDEAPAWVIAGGQEYEHTGRVNFTSSRVNPRTGTVSVRAEFPNPDRQLIPGQFVRVRVALKTFDDVYLIDPAAVSEGQQGPQVFTIGEDQKAQARPVKLGPIVDGKQVVIDGLQAGDQLVVNGHVTLFDGAQVQVANDGGNGEV